MNPNLFLCMNQIEKTRSGFSDHYFNKYINDDVKELKKKANQ